MQSTALILRDPHLPEIHILECDGPSGVAEVHRYPGEFTSRPYMSFEDYAALPDHSKFPRDAALWVLEHNAARRCYRLMEYAERAGGYLSPLQLREIRGRLKILSPSCDEDL